MVPYKMESVSVATRFTMMVAGLFLLGGSQLGSSLKIEVSKQYIDDVVTTSFNVRCTPETELDTHKFVVMMDVSRNDGKTVATILGNDHIYRDSQLQSKVTAEGHLGNLMNQTYLSVTVGEVTEEDSGLYTCSMQYMDGFGRVERKTASQNVTIAGYDVQDMLRHFVDKVLRLDSHLKDQQDKISTHEERFSRRQQHLVDLQQKLSEQNNITSALEFQVSAQKEKMIQQEMDISSRRERISAQREKLSVQEAKLTSQEEKLSHLEFELSAQKERLSNQEEKFSNFETALDRLEVKENDNLSTLTSMIDHLTPRLQLHEAEIQELIQNNSLTTAFSYRYGSHSFHEGQVVQFKHKILDIGNNFDPQDTGAFTAPVDGLYVFHISTCDEVDQKIDLLVNRINGGQQVKVATMFTDGKDGATQSSTSTIVHMQAGDTVSPFLSFLSDGNVVCGDDYSSVFSGYLLKRM